MHIFGRLCAFAYIFCNTSQLPTRADGSQMAHLRQQFFAPSKESFHTTHNMFSHQQDVAAIVSERYCGNYWDSTR